MQKPDESTIDISLRVLSVREVGKILQLHRAAVRKLLREGKLKGCRVGRLWRIRLSSVHEFLEELERSGSQGTDRDE